MKINENNHNFLSIIVCLGEEIAQVTNEGNALKLDQNHRLIMRRFVSIRGPSSVMTFRTQVDITFCTVVSRSNYFPLRLANVRTTIAANLVVNFIGSSF